MAKTKKPSRDNEVVFKSYSGALAKIKSVHAYKHVGTKSKIGGLG